VDAHAGVLEVQRLETREPALVHAWASLPSWPASIDPALAILQVQR
jgi:hypothetical protein